MNTHSPKDRVLFFDNLRTLMVLLVLVFHSAASYGSIVAFWPYHDPKPSALIDHTQNREAFQLAHHRRRQRPLLVLVDRHRQ